MVCCPWHIDRVRLVHQVIELHDRQYGPGLTKKTMDGFDELVLGQPISLCPRARALPKPAFHVGADLAA